MDSQNLILCGIVIVIVIYLIMKRCKNNEKFSGIPEGSLINNETGLGCCSWAAQQKWEYPNGTQVMATGSGPIQYPQVSQSILDGTSEDSNLRAFGPGCVCVSPTLKNIRNNN